MSDIFMVLEDDPESPGGAIVQTDLTELDITNDRFSIASDRLAWGQLIESVHI